MTGFSPLTPQEREQAFRRATSGFVKHNAQAIAKGMSDTALEAALERSLGIQGGSSGPGELYITFKGAGLKIWASHDHYWHIEQRPICQGQTTIKMAREVYQIADPTDAQLPLL